MPSTRTIQLQDICEVLKVRDRDARYVLERGFIPKGVNEKPASGTHRRFSEGQAFWLGMVLKLKATGIKTPLAAKIADYSARSVQTVTQNLGWDASFLPTQGRLKTENNYWVEIADLKYIRFGTDAEPSGSKRQQFDWHAVAKLGVPVRNVEPFVVIRLDIAHICRKLDRAFSDALH